MPVHGFARSACLDRNRPVFLGSCSNLVNLLASKRFLRLIPIAELLRSILEVPN